MRRSSLFRTLAACALFGTLATGPLAAKGRFGVNSPSFRDGAMLAPDDANGGPCGGRNLFPGLTWHDAPAGTRSFAVIVFDRDARKGRGVVHWVAYGYPPETTGIPESATAPAGPITGVGTRGDATYDGPCPPQGDPPHRYLYTVYALDLEPTAFPAGYTRDQLIEGMRDHLLGRARITGRFRRK